jgi:hypothetical protein
VARLHNHFSSGNVTVCSLCTVGLHIVVNSVRMFCTEILLWRIYVTGNNETYKGLHARHVMGLFLIFSEFGII